jgi:hypothetical protein
MTSAHQRPTSPWFYAVLESQTSGFRRASYITPEDITAAAVSGADPLELAKEVFHAISQGLVEDAKTCAFVTHGVLSLVKKA